MIVHLESLQSNCRESVGLTGDFATLPGCEENISSSGFRIEEGYRRRAVNSFLESF